VSVQTTPAEAPTPTPTVVLAAQSAPPARLATVEEIKAEIVRVFGSRSSAALCIAENESHFRSEAVGYNNDIHASHDRGVFQLNSYWHREVSDDEAYDARENIQHAYRISKAGTDWHQWSTRNICGVA